MAASSSSHTPTQNTSQFIKLNETNYLVWLRQIKPYLRGANLWGYVDGTIPEPDATITTPATTDTPAKTISNPAHTQWVTIDQQIVSTLNTSLTENIARLTVGFDTSKSIWDCLSRHFAQKSAASATSLKLQLFDLQKGSQTVDAYLQQAKSIADSLASINQPVSDADLVIATLHGLGQDYLMLRTALAQYTLPDFSDLRARILAFEAQQHVHSSDSRASALFHQGSAIEAQPRGSTVDAQSRSTTDLHSRGPPPRRDFRRPFNGGRHYQRRRGGASRPFPSSHPVFPSYGSSTWPSRPQGQNGLLGPGPQWCPNCHTNQHHLSQCPHRFAGPSTAPPFAGAHTFGDPNWYPDTGATHHMTAMPLPNSQPYGGPHNVYMGNGDSMPVTHSGPL